MKKLSLVFIGIILCFMGILITLIKKLINLHTKKPVPLTSPFTVYSHRIYEKILSQWNRLERTFNSNYTKFIFSENSD